MPKHAPPNYEQEMFSISLTAWSAAIAAVLVGTIVRLTTKSGPYKP